MGPGARAGGWGRRGGGERGSDRDKGGVNWIGSQFLPSLSLQAISETLRVCVRMGQAFVSLASPIRSELREGLHYIA